MVGRMSTTTSPLGGSRRECAVVSVVAGLPSAELASTPPLACDSRHFGASASPNLRSPHVHHHPGGAPSARRRPCSIRPSASRLDLAALADIGGSAEVEELWRPHVAHDHNERTRVRLLATSAYEVWLLGWTPGQSVGLHDHGGANGTFVVVDGTLTETVAADP